MSLAENLPVDVLAHIFSFLLERKCGLCNRVYFFEAGNSDMLNVKKVCDSWWAGHLRLIMKLLRGNILCFKPEKCVAAAIQHAGAVPFLRVKYLHKN